MGVKRERVVGVPMECERCHTTITRHSVSQRYCVNCRAAVKREHDAESNRRFRERLALEAEQRQLEAQARISPKNRTPTIEEVNAAAMAAGMSYGKYVATHGGGR